MDKVYFDKDSWTLKYEPWLNTVELEVSKQELDQVHHSKITDYVKNLANKILWWKQKEKK